MLNYKVYGDQQPVLIILHGLFGSLDNWQSIAQVFSSNFTVYIVDQRNHGKSPHFNEHNYTAMAADLLAFIDHFELETVHLLGHSMGGKTVMQFAVDYPDRVGKLIVADIAPKYYPPHHQQILKALKSVDFSIHNSRTTIQKIIAENIPELGVQQFLLKGLTWITKERMAWKFNLAVLSEQIDNIGEALAGHAYFTNPVLFLKGEHSDYILDEDLTLIESNFPQSELIVIENAGHWLHAENSKDFITEVLRFLK